MRVKFGKRSIAGMMTLLMLTASLPMFGSPSGAAPALQDACPGSGSPGVLDSAVAATGLDPSTGTADDCWFTFAPTGDPTGMQLRVVVTSTTPHSIFVARSGVAAASAGPYVCSVTASASASCVVFWPLTAPIYHMRVSRTGSDDTAGFSITAFYEAAPASGCSLGYAITPLTEAVVKNAVLSTAAGSRCYFKFDPAATADLAKFVSTGLPSLLGTYLSVREFDVPVINVIPGTTATADVTCAPLTGTTRTCTPNMATTGTTWYASLTKATATGASTSHNVTASSVSSCSLGRGYHTINAGDVITTATVSLDAGAKCDFLLNPSQVESLSRFTLTPGAANTDIYVFKMASAAPVPIPRAGFACSAVSTSLTVPDVCAVAQAGSPGILATVYRPAVGTAATGFTLKAEAVEGCSIGGVPTSGVTQLADNAPISAALSNDFDAFCDFHFAPNELEATVRVATGPAQSAMNATLYVKKGSPASPASYDCIASFSATVAGTCDVLNDNADIYARLRRVNGSASVPIFARAFSPCAFDDGTPGGGVDVLQGGVAATGSLTSDTGGACQFKFVVPGSADAASFALVPDEAADFDLYAKFGQAPTTSSYNCKSSNPALGAAESCVNVLGAGTYYALVNRVDGSGPYSITASAVSSCSLGTATAGLARDVALAGSLIDADGAKCYFSFTPGNPTANPLNPGNDVVKFSLAPASGNFDLYVRKGSLPTTATYDCRSILAGTAVDTCQSLVSDGSTYYVMVRRTSGSGDFGITATTFASCGLGAGMHTLADNVDPGITWSMAGATCWFKLTPTPGADFVQFDGVVPSAPANTLISAAMSVGHNYVPTTSHRDCGGSPYAYNYPSLGLVGNAPVQCGILLDDGLPWYATVTATSAGVPLNFKGATTIIPALENGKLTDGFVDIAGTQYWKVVLPEGVSEMHVQTLATDVSGTACGIGSTSGSPQNADVSLACLLAPLPSLVGCALIAAEAASQGLAANCGMLDQTTAARCAANLALVQATAGQGPLPASCGMVDQSLAQRCMANVDVRLPEPMCNDVLADVNPACGMAETVRPNLCAGLDGTSTQACGLLAAILSDIVPPNLCSAIDGSYTRACAFVNARSLPKGCTASPLDNAAVKPMDLDLYVRYKVGLPTTSVNDCASRNPGAIESCSFGETLLQARSAFDTNRVNVNANLTGITSLVNSNRGPADAALAGQGQTAPATPGPQLPVIPGTAKPMLGSGRYFIAVKGPASGLLNSAGAYKILALWNEVPAAPSL